MNLTKFSGSTKHVGLVRQSKVGQLISWLGESLQNTPQKTEQLGIWNMQNAAVILTHNNSSLMNIQAGYQLPLFLILNSRLNTPLMSTFMVSHKQNKVPLQLSLMTCIKMSMVHYMQMNSPGPYTVLYHTALHLPGLLSIPYCFCWQHSIINQKILTTTQLCEITATTFIDLMYQIGDYIWSFVCEFSCHLF